MDQLPQESRTLAEVLELHPLLPLAWNAATTAGYFLRDQRPHELAIDTKSSASDAVTAMDRGSETVIRDLILSARPDDAIMGEEGGARPGSTDVRWIVDPLDGTVNYLYRLPMWGVSVAVEVAGEIAVGVISAPDLDEDYIAVRGQGAWLIRRGRAERLRVRGCQGLPTALVVTGFTYSPAMRTRQAQVVERIIDRVRDIRRLGSAVIDFCWLARGRIDAFYEKGLNEWDVAAGGLIAREAGAVVDGLVGDDLNAMVFVSVPEIAEELRALLIAAGADLP